MMRAQDFARQLLATETAPIPLHGDLHHDNVRLTDRGYCAFDAKGLVGERCFELANAFRHPRGLPEHVRDPARLRFLRDSWADVLGLDARRLMGWAVAKTALSIVWRSSDALSDDPELDLLDAMIALFDDT